MMDEAHFVEVCCELLEETAVTIRYTLKREVLVGCIQFRHFSGANGSQLLAFNNYDTTHLFILITHSAPLRLDGEPPIEFNI